MSDRIGGWRVWPGRDRGGKVVSWNAQRRTPRVRTWERYEYLHARSALEMFELISGRRDREDQAG